MKNDLKKIDLKLLYLGIIVSILSQIPSLMNNSVISLIYTGALLLFLILSLCKDDLKLKIPAEVIAIPIVIDIILFFLFILSFFKNNYFQSNLFVPINMCCFFSIIGYFFGKNVDKKSLKTIVKIIVYSTLILAFSIFKDYFLGVDWTNASSYLYGSKNSVATIFLISIIIMIIFINDFNRIFVAGAILFLSLVILMTKSRANIVCLVIIILYMVFTYIENKKLKLFLSLIILIFGIAIFSNESLYNFFINNIVFNNKSRSNFNVITSGRDVQYKYFFEEFPKNFMIGTGGTYIECNFMTVLLSYGIIGGLPILIYSIYPLIYPLKNNIKKRNYIFKIRYLVLSLSIILFINGFFEEQAPFGPGVKCFSLWFFFGVYISLKAKDRLKLKE